MDIYIANTHCYRLLKEGGVGEDGGNIYHLFTETEGNNGSRSAVLYTKLQRKDKKK